MKLLKPSTLKEMQRGQWVNPDGKTTWGLGFVIDDVKGERYEGHNGSCPGYRTSVTIESKTKLGVVVMVNTTGVDPTRYAQIITRILNRYTAVKMETTKSPRSLADYAGIYNEMDWGSEQRSSFPGRAACYRCHFLLKIPLAPTLYFSIPLPLPTSSAMFAATISPARSSTSSATLPEK